MEQCMSLYDIWAEDHRCYADLVYDLIFKSKQMSQCRQLQPLPLLPQPPAQQPPLSFSQSTPSKNAAATAPALEQSRIQNRLAAVSESDYIHNICCVAPLIHPRRNHNLM